MGESMMQHTLRKYSAKATSDTGMHAWRRALTDSQISTLNFLYDAAKAE